MVKEIPPEHAAFVGGADPGRGNLRVFLPSDFGPVKQCRQKAIAQSIIYDTIFAWQPARHLPYYFFDLRQVANACGIGSENCQRTNGASSVKTSRHFSFAGRSECRLCAVSETGFGN